MCATRPFLLIKAGAKPYVLVPTPTPGGGAGTIVWEDQHEQLLGQEGVVSSLYTAYPTCANVAFMLNGTKTTIACLMDWLTPVSAVPSACTCSSRDLLWGAGCTCGSVKKYVATLE